MDCPCQFGPYQLIRRLAVGGMAEIYLAKVAGLVGIERLLVLKVIHPRYAEDPDFIQMLVHEAKLAVKLNHANIAQVFDLGVHNTLYYIALEYVDGLDLHQLLRQMREVQLRMPFEIVAYIVAEVCAGLDYAHKRKDVDKTPLGIIHRDISPHNILVSHDGDVKIIDFGIAKARAYSQNTAVGIIKGKFFYLSPEQARGEQLDQRSDIFTLGSLFYELLTGRMLYDTESVRDALKLAKAGQFLPPSTHREDTPKDLEDIAVKALCKSRQNRFQTAGEVRTELTAWLRRHAPGFGRHRLEKFITRVTERQLADSSTALGRHEFEIRPEHSMIFTQSPSGSPKAVQPGSLSVSQSRSAKSETRQIAPSSPDEAFTPPQGIKRHAASLGRPSGAIFDSSAGPTNDFDPDEAATVELFSHPLSDTQIPIIDDELVTLLPDVDLDDTLDERPDTTGDEFDAPTLKDFVSPMAEYQSAPNDEPVPNVIVLPPALAPEDSPTPRMGFRMSPSKLPPLGSPKSQVTASLTPEGPALDLALPRPVAPSAPGPVPIERPIQFPDQNRSWLWFWIPVCVGAVIAGSLLFFAGLSKRISTAETGRVFVTTQPMGAQVWLDGHLVDGTTPLVISGVSTNQSHEIRASLHGYSAAVDYEVQIDPHREAEVVFQLQPITFTATIESRPQGADVVISGAVVGQTPITITEIEIGERRAVDVSLRLAGFQESPFTLRWPTGQYAVERVETLVRAE